MAENDSSTFIPYGPSRKPWRETLSSVAISAAGDGEILVSAPSTDPLERELVPDGVTSSLYQVPSSGLTSEEHDRAMEETLRLVKHGSVSFCGFMNNVSFKFPPLFDSPFANAMMNNAGDPFNVGTAFYLQPKWMERGILDYYASLWNAKWPHDPNDPETYWGYVLTMGSSEGNIHALWSARNYLAGRYVQTATNGGDHSGTCDTTSSALSKEPVVFFSQNSNSSLPKLCDLVSISAFDVVGRDTYPNENPLGGDGVPGVPCTGGDEGPGIIDIDALEKLVDFFSSKGHPIVVIYNYGTTLKGSCDDVKTAGERLVRVLEKNNMYERMLLNPNDSGCTLRKGYWFHIDGALATAYMPFLEMAFKNGQTDIQPGPVFDFRLPFVTSIVMSGHKFIGIPWPCGVYIIRNSKRLTQNWSLPYSGSYDRTVSFSRNGHSAILLWSYNSTNSYDAQVASVLECLRVVTYAVRQFHELQRILGIDLWVINTPPSLSILFRRPNARIIQKYSLSSTTLCINYEKQPIVQICVMQHVTTDKIDSLIEDLKVPGAFE